MKYNALKWKRLRVEYALDKARLAFRHLVSVSTMQHAAMTVQEIALTAGVGDAAIAIQNIIERLREELQRLDEGQLNE